MFSKRWNDEFDFTKRSGEIRAYLENVERTNSKFMHNNIYLLDLLELEEIVEEEDKEIVEQCEGMKLLYINQLNYETSILIYGLIINSKYQYYLLMSDSNDADEHYEGIHGEYFMANIDYIILPSDDFKMFFKKANSLSEFIYNCINAKYFENWGIMDVKCKIDYKECFKCKKLKECNEKLEYEVDSERSSADFWEDYALCNPIDC